MINELSPLKFILIIYAIPVFICIIMLYYDKEIKTIGDFLNFTWPCFTPVLNIIMILLNTAESLVYLLSKIFNTTRFFKILKIKKHKLLKCKLHKPSFT